MSMTKCLIAGCKKVSDPLLKRGLCVGCHAIAKQMVDNGSTTWDRLVAHGFALSIVNDRYSVTIDKNH